jgi:hypothetical protein
VSGVMFSVCAVLVNGGKFGPRLGFSRAVRVIGKVKKTTCYFNYFVLWKYCIMMISNTMPAHTYTHTHTHVIFSLFLCIPVLSSCHTTFPRPFAWGGGARRRVGAPLPSCKALPLPLPLPQTTL